jgi:hypothetical protein
MSGNTHREVMVERIEKGRLRAVNAGGGVLEFGGGGAEFSPIELLLTALAGCSALDVDALTSRPRRGREPHGRPRAGLLGRVSAGRGR